MHRLSHDIIMVNGQSVANVRNLQKTFCLRNKGIKLCL